MNNRPPNPLAPHERPVTPRDLAGLAVALAIVVIPHALRLPWWLTALALGLYAWRALLAIERRALPARWILMAITACAILGVWIEYRMVFGRAPGIALLVLFSGLKLLECRTQRDASVVAFLCYFLIITNLLYEQSIPTAILMVLALVAVTATLVAFNAPNRAWLPNLRTATLLFAQAGPVALALFLFFPRVPGPLWGLPRDAHAAVSGLSDAMSPGGIAQLVLSDSIAFRAEFESSLPAPRERYWRGPVLWEFDGRTWSMGASFHAPFRPPTRGDAVYRYAVLLEPQERNWLFALERAASLPPQTTFTTDGQILARVPVRTRMRYEVTSISNAQHGADISAFEERRALRLPADYNPRARALAAEWRAAAASDDALLERAIQYLRGANLAYTLEPPLLGRDFVDEFLFQTRAGFCEHFASAFVFLMRAAGLPARVVTGYQGGELNPIDRILTVRQSDAHAWAEVYLRGRGWLRVDPTAVAVPGRVEAGLSRAVPLGERMPLMLQPRFEWLRSLRHNWEAITHKWNVWFLGYDPTRQRELMALVGLRDADWRSLTAALAAILGSLAALLVAWSLGRVARPDPVQGAWQSFCAKLAARGVVRAQHEGPRDYAERAARSQPAAQSAIHRIGALYLALRYGAAQATGEVAELRRLVRALRLT